MKKNYIFVLFLTLNHGLFTTCAGKYDDIWNTLEAEEKQERDNPSEKILQARKEMESLKRRWREGSHPLPQETSHGSLHGEKSENPLENSIIDVALKQISETTPDLRCEEPEEGSSAIRSLNGSKKNKEEHEKEDQKSGNEISFLGLLSPNENKHCLRCQQHGEQHGEQEYHFHNQQNPYIDFSVSLDKKQENKLQQRLEFLKETASSNIHGDFAITITFFSHPKKPIFSLSVDLQNPEKNKYKINKILKYLHKVFKTIIKKSDYAIKVLIQHKDLPLFTLQNPSQEKFLDTLKDAIAILH